MKLKITGCPLYKSFIKDLLITQGPKQRREDQGSPGEQPQGRNKQHPHPLPLFYVGKADYFSDNTPTDNEFSSRGNLQFGVLEKKNEKLFISK